MAQRPSANIRIPRWARNLGGVVQSVNEQALAETKSSLSSFAKKNASKGGTKGLRVRTGTLLRSIRTYLKKDGKGGGTLSLGVVFYGWVHNSGAVIVPVRATRLRFYIPGAGWRTSKRVVLPQRPWATDAIESARREYPRYLRLAIARATT